MTPPEFFNAYRSEIDTALGLLLTDVSVKDSRLHDAMRYSVLLGGKRIRPILCLASAKAFDIPSDSVMNAACAVELIHAYSLVHDDLPAMDDDDLRRGQATCHIAFDEATAILTGDALQAAAFELLTTPDYAQSDACKLIMLRTLTQASGARGMVLGQAIDLDSVGKQLDLDKLEDMHRHKTGKLIEAAILMGAQTGSASPSELAALEKFAEHLGLAFQVCDDILDVTGKTEELGKQSGADIALNKPTYVSLLGLQGAKEKLRQCYENCESALSELTNRDTTELRQIAQYVVERQH